MMRRALKWQVHPPTTYCFAKHLLFLLPFSSVPMDTRHDVLELARFLTELSVIDYYFVAHEPSAIALAALQNAMDLIPGVSDAARQEFLKELRRVSKLNIESPQVTVLRDRLRLLYAQGGYACPTEARSDLRSEAISPVCVSAYPQYYQPVAPPPPPPVQHVSK
jgi:Cyclin, C-terminal domain